MARFLYRKEKHKDHAYNINEDSYETLNTISEWEDNNITINRLLVITSKYHAGRSYWVFQKVFENSKVEIGIIGSNDYIDYSRWWFDYNMSEIILLEKARFLFYRLVGLINPSIMDV